MNFSDIDLQWFAAEDEGRTEEPSEYKLKKAREEGRVAKSQELGGALVMFVTVMVLIICAKFFFRNCAEIMVYFFTRCAEPTPFQRQYFVFFIVCMVKMVLPLVLSGVVAGVLANIVQNKGFIFSTKMPKT